MAAAGSSSSVARRISSVAATLPSSKTRDAGHQSPEPAAQHGPDRAAGTAVARAVGRAMCADRVDDRGAASRPGMIESRIAPRTPTSPTRATRAAGRGSRRGCPSRARSHTRGRRRRRHDVGQQRIAGGHAQPARQSRRPRAAARPARRRRRRSDRRGPPWTHSRRPATARRRCGSSASAPPPRRAAPAEPSESPSMTRASPAGAPSVDVRKLGTARSGPRGRDRPANSPRRSPGHPR